MLVKMFQFPASKTRSVYEFIVGGRTENTPKSNHQHLFRLPNCVLQINNLGEFEVKNLIQIEG